MKLTRRLRHEFNVHLESPSFLIYLPSKIKHKNTSNKKFNVDVESNWLLEIPHILLVLSALKVLFLTGDNINSLPSEEGLFSPSQYYFIALAVHWKLSLRLIGSIILHTGAARMGEINLCIF